MKIPKYVKDHIRKMSDLARKQQIMNNQLNTYLEKLGVDMEEALMLRVIVSLIF